MKQNWQAVIESRPGFEHPAYSIAHWKRDVAEGRTLRGYAQTVAEMITASTQPLPPVLRQFKPRSNMGKAVQLASITEFNLHGACFPAVQNGHGWYAMRFAFENLIPFIVARGPTTFIVAKDTPENRKDLADAKAEILFEWDGFTMVDDTGM